MIKRVGVVGAGVVGLAVARQLGRSLPGTQVTVLEKEDQVACHQTSHNSGVVHAGLYYAPGSLKATLSRAGVAMLREYCQEKSLPFTECGKLVVAVDASELPALERIEQRATENGVSGLRRVGAREIGEIEPHAAGVAGVYSPHTAVTDFAALARAYAEDVAATGGQVRLSTAVRGVRRTGERIQVATGNEVLEFDRLVICAGLQADRVARWAGVPRDLTIMPFRGEYYTLAPDKEHLVRALIYPVPDPRYPFLGVHFTRRISGVVDIGPNAVPALAREGYRWRDISGSDLLEMLAWPGSPGLARRHWRMGLTETAGSISRKIFLNRARRYVPALEPHDVVRAPAGVRAQAVDRAGNLLDDFRISRIGPVTAIRNAPSPAATASLAIAERVCREVLADV